ncbi:hypothetical protein E2C01_086743 [Portunus trituberculatus]|uniref:Uncharacterized protein n=1 Tax=Portunus trituberculatus TaxID=210409 RepID=A0A5B7JFG1_PORTR|nr:hypothetical protein [Portunus trituberculatus]
MKVDSDVLGRRRRVTMGKESIVGERDEGSGDRKFVMGRQVTVGRLAVGRRVTVGRLAGGEGKQDCCGDKVEVVEMVEEEEEASAQSRDARPPDSGPATSITARW